MARPQIAAGRVRRLEPRDLDAVLRIEFASRPFAARWTPESYLPAPHSEMSAWVSENAAEITGFVLARYAGDEMELLNVAVEPSLRRSGVGRALIRAAVAEGAARGARAAFLEVRESNAAALAFYTSLGFKQVGRRSGYYSDPPEDALILSNPLPP